MKYNFKLHSTNRKNYSNRAERRQAAEQVRNALVGMELDIEEEREEHLSAEYHDWYDDWYFEDYLFDECKSCGKSFNDGYMGTCSDCHAEAYNKEIDEGLSEKQQQDQRDWVEGNRILDEHYESAWHKFDDEFDRMLEKAPITPSW
jgi:hypothetical protein